MTFTNVDLLFWLFFVHLLADFALQGEFVTKYKGKSIVVGLVHGFLWAGCVGVVLALAGHFHVAWMGILAVSHAWCDWWKMNALTGDDSKDYRLFYIDQCLMPCKF